MVQSSGVQQHLKIPHYKFGIMQQFYSKRVVRGVVLNHSPKLPDLTLVDFPMTPKTELQLKGKRLDYIWMIIDNSKVYRI